MASRPDLYGVALDMAADFWARIEGGQVPAEDRMSILLALSRATLRVDEDEARAYFTRATTDEGRYGERLSQPAMPMTC